MLIAILLLYCNFLLINKKDKKLSAYLKSVLVWNLYMYSSTELLSLFQCLHFTSVLLAWGILDLALMVFLIVQLRQKTQELNFQLFRKSMLKNLDKPCFIFLFFSVLVVFLAIKTVPYNWDSMTYHLSRIAHWAQNETVAHYATNVIRQITSPVLAEFINLHLYILMKGSDVAFNLLQCTAFLTNAVIIYAIAKKLHCNKFFSYLAAVLFLCMPTAFAEALTTQVDQLAALWMLIFVYYILDFVNPEQKMVFQRDSLEKVFLLSLCVGFGYLTKPTVSIAMLIMLIWLLVICIVRKDRALIVVKFIFCALPGILVTVIPEMARNIITFSAISAPIAGQRQLVGTLNPFYLIVNFLKNFTMNLPNVYIYKSEKTIAEVVKAISDILHVDMNNTSISEDGIPFLLRAAPEYGHDIAINSTILLLLIITVILAVWRVRKIGPVLLSYSFIAVFSFLILCVIMRWNRFVSRYMLSYLAVLCPVIALELQKLRYRRPKDILLTIVCFLCAVDMFGNMFHHANLTFRHGLSIRPDGYFYLKEEEYSSYQEITQYINEKHYTQVGVYTSEDEYEYPVWKMLNTDNVRIEHVNVLNVSQKYVDRDFQPECVIVLENIPEALKSQFNSVKKFEGYRFVLEKK